MIWLFTLIAMGIVLSFCIMAGIQYYFTGTVNFEKPPKRTHYFEDENGERDNPFHSEELETSDEWKYPVD